MEWLGLVARMSPDRTPRRLLFGLLADGHRQPRCCLPTLPRHYAKDIAALTGAAGTTGTPWQERARDETLWSLWIRCFPASFPPPATVAASIDDAMIAVPAGTDETGQSNRRVTRSVARAACSPLAPALTRVNRPGGRRPPLRGQRRG